MTDTHRMANIDSIKARRISPEEIRLLLALSEPASFTAVALDLGVTQSAVSKAVVALEERYGVELVSRGRHGCCPSEFLLKARPSLRRAAHALSMLEESLTRDGTQVSGRIRIAGFRSATSILLPPVVSGFLDRNPAAELSISTVREAGGGVVEQVVKGNADFGITSIKPPASLRSCLLGSDHYLLVQRRSRGDGRKDLSDRIVLWNEKCSSCVPAILESLELKPKRTVQVEDDSTVLGMIQHGGFTIMPRLATEPLPAGLQAKVLKEFRRKIWLCGSPIVWTSMSGRLLRRAIVAGAERCLAGDA
jgi:DNA-binding transcriptional LysR family regulator